MSMFYYNPVRWETFPIDSSGCRHGYKEHVNDISAKKNKYRISHGAVERGNTPRFTLSLLLMVTQEIRLMVAQRGQRKLELAGWNGLIFNERFLARVGPTR